MDEYKDGHVEVMYLTAHSGHELGANLPLPTSTKETISVKVSQGIPSERITDGIALTTLLIDGMSVQYIYAHVL